MNGDSDRAAGDLVLVEVWNRQMKIVANCFPKQEYNRSDHPKPKLLTVQKMSHILWVIRELNKPWKLDLVTVPWFYNNDSVRVLHWKMFGHLDSNIDHVDTHKEMKVDRPESSVYFSIT